MTFDHHDLLADPLMTPAEVAKWLQVSPKTVSTWGRRGLLKSHRTLGGHRRFRRSDVQAAINKAGSG